MQVTNVTYNRIVTVVETESNQSVVFSFRTKKEFWGYLNTLECFSMRVSQNMNKVIETIKELGFEVIVQKSEMYNDEAKLICTK